MGIAGTRTVVTMPHDKSKPPDSKNPLIQAQWRADQRAEKGASKPDVWIFRKGVVGFVYGLVAWTGYVVIGRVAVPMLRRREDAGGSVGAGVGIIVGYVLLWLMFMWTYTMIVITGPGFARDHVAQSEDPNPPIPEHSLTHHSSSDTAVEPDNQEVPNVSELDGIANVLPPVHPYPTLQEQSMPTANYQWERHEIPPESLVRPRPQYHHGPRWCRFCKIIKPDRTHHCKHCGTCILLYDHHCPWIGQCVGWGNHKAFIVFCGWASLLALYIVLAGVIKSAKTAIVDGQVIGSIAAATLFGFFTFSMFTTHLTLIHRNTSTVESFALQDQSEREATLLQREFGFCGGFKLKKAVRRRWNEEYGGVKVDGRWRVGGEMREVMGDKWWSWFLPIGRSKGDGVHFTQDPRFGPNGEWLPKSQWPNQATT